MKARILPPLLSPLRRALVLGLAASVFANSTSAGDLGDLADSPEPPFAIPAPGTYALPPIKRAGDGEVLGHEGAPRRLSEFTTGAVTVLSFIYTRCSSAKACPFATGVLNQVHRETGNDPKFAGNLRLVSVSFDPENDTPGRMAAYSQWARDREFQVEWSFLTTASARELQPILKAYNQAVDRRRNPGDPAGPLSHVLRVFLIDAKGMIRNIYSADTLDPRVVLADIETLLMESGAAKDPS